MSIPHPAGSAARRAPHLALALLVLSAAAAAQEHGEGIGFMAPMGDGARYALTLTPAAPGAPRMTWNDASGSLVVLRRSSDTWSLSGRMSGLELSRSPVVAGSGLVVPSKLWDVQVGGAFSRRSGDRKGWGASIGIGSASDVPFHSIHEAETKASVHRESPGRERDSWLLFLAYSNNRSFLNNVPFPGAAYVFREPIPGLQATLGFPFMSASYQPGKDWRASAALFGLANVSVEGARRLPADAWAYVRFARSPSQWLRAGRAERADRLVFDRRELRVGVRGRMGGGVSLDVSAGRDFRRRFYESRDADRSDVPRAELADAWTGALRLSWRR